MEHNLKKPKDIFAKNSMDYDINTHHIPDICNHTFTLNAIKQMPINCECPYDKLLPNNDRKQQCYFNHMILHNLEEGIILADKKNFITYSNQSFLDMSEYTLAELQTLRLSHILQRDESVLNPNLISEYDSCNPKNYETVLRVKNDSKLPVAVKIFPFVYGKYNGTVFIITDISEKRKQLEQLNRALVMARTSENLKNIFLSNLSHEIRTPLNAIIGFSSILKEKQNVSIHECADFLEIIEMKGYELLDIMDNLIDIARIKSRSVKIQKQKFELKLFLESCFLKFKQQVEISKKPVQTKLTLPSEPGKLVVNTDRFYLNKIVCKLLDNSLKFTNNGEIELGYTITNEGLCFFVRDTGLTISKEESEIIFEQFWQVEEYYSRNAGSTGIGLNICMELIKLLGGKMWVVSNQNEANTFYFTIGEKEISKL